MLTSMLQLRPSFREKRIPYVIADILTRNNRHFRQNSIWSDLFLKCDKCEYSAISEFVQACIVANATVATHTFSYGAVLGVKTENTHESLAWAFHSEHSAKCHLGNKIWLNLIYPEARSNKWTDKSSVHNTIKTFTIYNIPSTRLHTIYYWPKHRREISRNDTRNNFQHTLGQPSFYHRLTCIENVSSSYFTIQTFRTRRKTSI